MTCRMHQVPGFHNADSTIRRDPYMGVAIPYTTFFIIPNWPLN